MWFQLFNFQLYFTLFTALTWTITTHLQSFTIKKRKGKGGICTEAKGATAFELATVMLAVELEPNFSKYGKLNGHLS